MSPYCLTELTRLQFLLKGDPLPTQWGWNGYKPKTVEVEMEGLLKKYIPSHISSSGEPTPLGTALLQRKTIPAAEFAKNVWEKPDWAASLTEDLEILGTCDINANHISTLSSHLFFGGEAYLQQTKHLRNITGNFAEGLTAHGSEVETITDVYCGRNAHGWAAGLSDTTKLKSIQGTFDGALQLTKSAILTIQGIRILRGQKGNSKFLDGTTLVLHKCRNLVPHPRLDSPYIIIEPELLKKVRALKALLSTKEEISI